MLKHKRILLGVTGGIAAYKSAEIIRFLQQQGAIVRVVMTRSSQEFITKLTLQALSGFEVHDELLDEKAELAMSHIALGRWADVVLIAPATADFIAKLNEGRADDLLSAVCLVTQAPVVLAPSMNHAMWAKPVTQENLNALVRKGFINVGVGEGYQACLEQGLGRLLEPALIVEGVIALFKTQRLQGLHVMVTAGPTREYIDPVRYLSNRSSGKMGYAVAQAAAELGAAVTLISGPVALTAPAHVRCVSVETAEEMLKAVLQESCDIFISVAAVVDYRPEKTATQKLKRTVDAYTLQLIPNPDILKTVSLQTHKPFCVGFAAETEHFHEYALKKLHEKNIDMVCMNDVSDKNIGFDSDDNALTVLYRDGKVMTLERAPKTRLAHRLMNLIADKIKT